MNNGAIAMFRSLKDVIQNARFENMAVVNELCAELSKLIKANVILINKSGKVLSSYTYPNIKSLVNIKDIKGVQFIDNQFNEQLKSVYGIKYNISLSGYYLKNIPTDEIEQFKVSIFPTIAAGERNGTLIAYTDGEELQEEKLSLVDFCSTVISIIVAYSQNEEDVAETRKKEMVKSALGTLSYSELEAIVHIFRELDGSEGLLVASKVAAKAGITRSVIVNALRKLESAGVTESRSLGMKGTYIKVTNDYLLEEMKNYIN